MRSAFRRWPPVTRRCCRQLVKALKEQGADDIIVFAGGVIPAQDYDYLYNAGAKAIFGPGTRIEDSARKVLEEIRKARG